MAHLFIIADQKIGILGRDQAGRVHGLHRTHQKDAGHTYSNWVNDGILGSAGVPLIAQEKLIGYIWVGAALEISTTQVRLLAAIADIAANAIHRATLHEQTQKNTADLALAYNTTLVG